MVVLGVQRGKMGSNTYYIGKMSAGELVDNVGFASELPEWAEMSADEKIQRQLDTTRVINEIVPYIIEDKDRFFGSLIIDIFSGFDELEFEAVSDIVTDLPAAYRIPMKDMGFLTLPGKERLIALDGQHRLLSLKISLKGFMGLPAGTKVTPAVKDLVPHPELAKEEISVIFVEHRDNYKIRKIFNKVNKYARQTSRGDNIITSDDDVFALISRRLFSEGEPLERIGNSELVNWKTNALSQRSKHLTTISALYTIAETILKDEEFSSKMLPNEDRIEIAYEEIATFWTENLNKIYVYQKYLELARQDKPVSTLREENLLMRPVTQMALAHVAYFAKKKEILWKDIVGKLNKIDWSFNNPLWYNIMVIGSAQKKMITGKEAVRAAGQVISYMIIGDSMNRSEQQNVSEIVRNAKNNEKEPLPERV